mmetsp:Transcript_84736/g.234960  ORF Transcript_84736/g.234960 Transcript_84736/m.234960 type:complete len:82 (+) Transcript_84736:312-557(+)
MPVAVHLSPVSRGHVTPSLALAQYPAIVKQKPSGQTQYRLTLHRVEPKLLGQLKNLHLWPVFVAHTLPANEIEALPTEVPG